MEIYIYNLFFIVISALFLKRRLKIYLGVNLIVFVLIAALRAETVGFDTINYRVTYTRIQRLTWNYIFFDLQLGEKEPGYLLLNKALSILDLDFRYLLLSAAILILAPIFFFVFKHSKSAMLSLFFYYSWGHYAASLCTIRQAIAVSILLFAVDALIAKRYWNSAAIMLLAMMFHRTALMFLAVILLRILEGTKLKPLIVGGMIATFALFGKEISMLLYENMARSNTVVADGSGLSQLLVFTLLYIFCALFSIKGSGKDFEIQTVFNDVMETVILLQILALRYNVLARAGNAMTIAAFLLLPNLFIKEKSNGTSAVKVWELSALAFAFLGYYVFIVLMRDVSGSIPYKFFWEV